MRPEDDYTHLVGPEPNFNESMYFYFHDAAAGLAGFTRLANRPNEGKGEMTVCLYLPDGSVGFSFARPDITSNESFDAAGMRFVVREPMRHLDVSYEGRLSVLRDPSLLVDPGTAFRSSPQVGCAITLEFEGVAPPFNHSFDTGEGSFAPNHYEQFLTARGQVRVGEQVISVAGYGLRDHSWGPRYWQTPWFYRWIHGCTDGFGFMGAWFGRPNGSAVRGGFVWDGATSTELNSLEISTVRDARDEQVAVTAVLRAGDQEWKMQGSTVCSVPLRHRRVGGHGDVQVTRIVEALTRWTSADGQVLHGMSEYLDQIVDGRPAGLAV